MTLALSHQIAFFASTLPLLPSSSFTSRCVPRQWKYNHHHRLEDPKGRVLLLASDKDLQAAIHGKWRRLDHVTLSCFAW
ncbi:uncharacterized protein BX664DRAFT_340779 [Halteromyces radiatus]|uniref:uncharacterized protein n=1 Tax=Halteromyces radiatus TaxID=101107 RepID=UPI0022206877|nr:uncharacterized protein BX664DRAFT_340779 [Halteromyces radiatus]KAI8081592.1 hypothetical protein BX664DRAFT_340779 [Halteromyces radiatus]